MTNAIVSTIGEILGFILTYGSMILEVVFKIVIIMACVKYLRSK